MLWAGAPYPVASQCIQFITQSEGCTGSNQMLSIVQCQAFLGARLEVLARKQQGKTLGLVRLDLSLIIAPDTE